MSHPDLCNFPLHKKYKVFTENLIKSAARQRQYRCICCISWTNAWINSPWRAVCSRNKLLQHAQIMLQIHTEDFGGLLQNFFQLLLAPARHGPLQVPFRTLGHSPGHLLHHKLPREPGGSEDHQVVRPARGCFYARHSDSRRSGRARHHTFTSHTDWQERAGLRAVLTALLRLLP